MWGLQPGIVTFFTHLNGSCSIPQPRGVPAIFICGCVCMKGQIQIQKYGFTVNFAPMQKYCDPAACLLLKNMGDHFILVISLIARNYF